MKKYKLQMKTTGASLPWEYNTEYLDDADAVKHAKELFPRDKVLRGVMALLIWNIDEERLVTSLVLTDPGVREE